MLQIRDFRVIDNIRKAQEESLKIQEESAKAQKEMVEAVTLLTKAIIACNEQNNKLESKIAKEGQEDKASVAKKFDEIINAIKALKPEEPKATRKSTKK